MPSATLVHLHAAPVLGPLLVGVVAVWLLALGHRRSLTVPRALTVVVVSTYAAAVVALTLFPVQLAFGNAGNSAPWWTQVNVVPLVNADPEGLALNVLMTLPLGLALPLLARVDTVARAALVGLVVSGSIEAVQGLGNLVVSSGRTADVDDVLANVAGTVLGLLLYRVATSVAGGALAAYGLPGSTAAGDEVRTGPGWFVDDEDEPGASTATTAAASSAVPKR